MDAPKLKNMTIVDQIKKRVGSTNFFDVTKLAEQASYSSLEELITSQEAALEADQNSAKEAERLLEKETDEEKIESLIKSLIFHKEMIENTKSYLTSIKPKMNDENRIEINKRMVGKTVLVLDDGSSWTGVVSDVLDESTFQVLDNRGNNRQVDIFDVRSL